MAETASNLNQSTETTLNPTALLKDEIDLVTNFYEVAITFFTNYSFQLIGALIIFFIGYWLAGKIGNAVLKLCEKNNLDITLSRFIGNTSKMIVVVLITIIALGKLGISVTPFIAAIGAISLGAGLAVQGLLANYAAGFNIIVIRPFVVGDTIRVQGVIGVVKEVLLAYTILVDEDGVDIMIPNKHIVGEVLQNSKENSLLDLSVGIAYNESPIKVIKLLEEAILPLNIISKEKTPQIGIDTFGDSSINLSVRIWIPTVNFFDAKHLVNKVIYETLNKNNITIPFPQRDIHLVNRTEEAA